MSKRFWLGVMVFGLIVLSLFLPYGRKVGIFNLYIEANSMHDGLIAYLEKQIAASDFAIHYQIGNDFSGESYFRLQGDGSYELWSTVTQGRQRKSYAGQVAASQVEAVVQEMLTSQIWQVRHIHSKAGEDDPEAMIAIEIAGQKSEVVLWVSEIKKSPPFGQVQRRLLSLIYDISSGEVLETGQ